MRQGFLQGCFLYEGHDLAVDRGSTLCPAFRGRAKTLSQASDYNECAGMASRRLYLCDEIGPQPKGFHALIPDVPVRDGRELAFAWVVQFHDLGHVCVVVGRQQVAIIFRSQETKDSGDLLGFHGGATGEQGKQGVEVVKAYEIVDLIHGFLVPTRL